MLEFPALFLAEVPFDLRVAVAERVRGDPLLVSLCSRADLLCAGEHDLWAYMFRCPLGGATMSLRKQICTRLSLLCLLVATMFSAAHAAEAQGPTEIEHGFRLLYEQRFGEAREKFSAWHAIHIDDPLGPASEAASYLFEEFYRLGILTSEFFLDDKRLLVGVTGTAGKESGAQFFDAIRRTQELAQRRLKANRRDAGSLFALTISAGMLADYAGLIEKRQFECLRRIRQAQGYARELLAIESSSADAYLTLGAANYILGCLPAYKRFFLASGGIHGDKMTGIKQLEMAAMHGHYLKPFAKILLALASLREKQVERARTLLEELTAEFPQNQLFVCELTKLQKPAA